MVTIHAFPSWKVGSQLVGWQVTRADTHSKTIGYILWTFGFTGSHRFYIGKWFSGIIYLLTVGLFGFGVLYDFWTLNEQINLIHAELGA